MQPNYVFARLVAPTLDAVFDGSKVLRKEVLSRDVGVLCGLYRLAVFVGYPLRQLVCHVLTRLSVHALAFPARIVVTSFPTSIGTLTYVPFTVSVLAHYTNLLCV